MTTATGTNKAGIVDKKVVYFIAGKVVTNTEAAEILALENQMRKTANVQIRSLLHDDLYANSRIEVCDAVAAHSDAVPTAYSGVALAATLVNYSTKVVPATAAFSSGNPQLYCVACDGKTSTDVTTAATWSTSDGTKATVGANTGILTKVGAGSCTITATYNGITSTCAVTVS
jgi:hypothetical protein